MGNILILKPSEVEMPAGALEEFCQRYQVKELSLFGSALGDGFGPESDFHLLVEFEPQARVGFLFLARMQRELSLILRRTVHLVPKSGLKARVREAVLAQGNMRRSILNASFTAPQKQSRGICQEKLLILDPH